MAREADDHESPQSKRYMVIDGDGQSRWTERSMTEEIDGLKGRRPERKSIFVYLPCALCSFLPKTYWQGFKILIGKIKEQIKEIK
jgi:hypothetical protein